MEVCGGVVIVLAVLCAADDLLEEFEMLAAAYAADEEIWLAVRE